MAEYIPREAIMKMAIEEKRFVFQMEDLLKREIVVKTVYKDFFDFIKSIPAADVAPVRHGRWIYHEETIRTLSHTRCSVCSSIRYEHYVNDFRFCPSCGARMDGGGD